MPYGIYKRKKKYNITKKYLIKKYNIEEYSINDICKEIGCSKQVIQDRFKKYGLKFRNKSQTQIVRFKRKLHPMRGKHHTEKTKKIISKKNLGKHLANMLVSHHIDTNKNNNKKSNKLKLTHSKHRKLHLASYDYLVKIGKIKKYIKWFKKEYGLK